MKNLKLPVFLLLLFYSTVAFPQQLWTLEDCIRYALENNIQLKRLDLQVRSSKLDYRQSKLDYLPGLEASGNHYVGEGKVLIYDPYGFVDKKSERGSWELGGSIRLFGGFGLHNSLMKSRFDYMAGLELLEKSKNDIAINISGAYLQVLFDEEILELSRKQIEVSELQVVSMKMQVDIGNYPIGKLFEVQAQLANDKYQETLAEENLHQSYLALAQMLQLGDIRNFRVVRSLGKTMEGLTSVPEQEEVYAYSSGNLPEIKSAAFQLRAAEKGLAASWSGLLPTISFGYGISTWFQDGYGPPGEPFAYFDQLKNNQTRYAGLNVSIPIFNKGSNLNRISKARLQKMDAALEYEQARQNLFSEIQKVRSEAIASMNRLASSQQAVIANEESYKFMDQQYTLGLVSYLELQVASAALMKSRSEQIQSKYNYAFRMMLLDFYLGRHFWGS